MENLYYKGPPRERPREPVDLPVNPRRRLDSAAGFRPDPGLVRAANAALILHQPLLLTGEPGVGKSQFAHALSYGLGLGDEALSVYVKSNATVRDLFYEFDELARFRDARQDNAGRARPLTDYLGFSPLGKAILMSGGANATTVPLPQAGMRAAGADRPILFGELLPGDIDIGQPRRSVVLIDEIDKAPRDLPNDILNEIDKMAFRVPEIGHEIRGNPEMEPILVITSNSEKNLPDAFLRRCVYYHIPFPPSVADKVAHLPEDERPPLLQDIVAARIEGLSATDPLVRDAVRVFSRIRDYAGGLSKKPSTSELLNWLILLKSAGDLGPGASLADNERTALYYLPALLKGEAPGEAIEALVRDALGTRPEAGGG